MDKEVELQRARQKLAQSEKILALLNEIIEICEPAMQQQRYFFTAEEAERVMRAAVKLYHAADEDKHREYALQLLREARRTHGIDHEFWDRVYLGVMLDSVWDKTRRRPAKRSEFALHTYLVEHWDEFFGGTLRLVQREFRIGTCRVDFLAEDTDGPVLIECKVGPIDVHALVQLQMYLRAYGRGRGILIGSELRIELPAGITFIPHRNLFLADAETKAAVYE